MFGATPRKSAALLERRLVFTLLVCVLLSTVAGCGGVSEETLLAAFDPYGDGSQRQNSMSYVEIDLGEFFVTFREPETGITRVFRSQLVAVVPVKAEEEFGQLKQQHEQRMREQVRVILQGVDIETFGPPTVRLLKSDVAKTVRRTLQTDNLKEVVFTELSIE
ncbi:MAG: hypothetical protein ACI9G1_001598 [Pirellulaceae bacterium]|jgi:hypothetical protein